MTRNTLLLPQYARHSSCGKLLDLGETSATRWANVSVLLAVRLSSGRPPCFGRQVGRNRRSKSFPAGRMNSDKQDLSPATSRPTSSSSWLTSAATAFLERAAQWAGANLLFDRTTLSAAPVPLPPQYSNVEPRSARGWRAGWVLNYGRVQRQCGVVVAIYCRCQWRRRISRGGGAAPRYIDFVPVLPDLMSWPTISRRRRRRRGHLHVRKCISAVNNNGRKESKSRLLSNVQAYIGKSARCLRRPRNLAFRRCPSSSWSG